MSAGAAERRPAVSRFHPVLGPPLCRRRRAHRRRAVLVATCLMRHVNEHRRCWLSIATLEPQTWSEWAVGNSVGPLALIQPRRSRSRTKVRLVVSAPQDTQARHQEGAPLRIVEDWRPKVTGRRFICLLPRVAHNRTSDVERFVAQRERYSTSDPGGSV